MTMPRAFYKYGLGAGPVVMCTYLWSYVRARKWTGGPHWVFHTRDELIDNCRDVSERTITAYLKKLRTPYLLVLPGTVNRARGFWLYTPIGAEDEKQPPDRPIAEQIERMRRGDLRSIVPRSPDQIFGDPPEISEEIFRDLPTAGEPEQGDLGRNLPMHPSIEIKLTTAAAEATTSPEPRAGSAAAAARDLPRSPGRELLAELAGPLASRGASIPPTKRTVALLDELLAGDGLDVAECVAMRSHVSQHVLAFADICIAEPTQRRFLCGEMFSQEARPDRLSRWAAIEKTVALHAGLAQQQQHTAAAEAAALEARRLKAQREAEERAHHAKHRVTPAHIHDFLATSDEPYAQQLRGLHREVREASEATDGEAQLARHREVSAFRRSLEGLGRAQLLALQAELGRQQAHDGDDRFKTQRAAVANRLADLEEASQDGHSPMENL